jgi:hypothetical protein
VSQLRLSDHRDGSVRFVDLAVDPVMDWSLGDIERRFLSPDELALIRERDQAPPPPKVKAIVGVIKQHEIDRRREQMRAERIARAAAKRDADRAELLARRIAERETRPLRTRPTGRNKLNDDDVVAVLRELRGNRAGAAKRLGVANQTLRQRVDVMRRYGLLPEDVAQMCSTRYRGAA